MNSLNVCKSSSKHQTRSIPLKYLHSFRQNTVFSSVFSVVNCYLDEILMPIRGRELLQLTSPFLILSVNSRSELLHQPQAVSQWRFLHQHRPGQLHLHLQTRVHRQKLRDRDQRVRQQPLQERWQLQSESPELLEQLSLRSGCFSYSFSQNLSEKLQKHQDK